MKTKAIFFIGKAGIFIIGIVMMSKIYIDMVGTLNSNWTDMEFIRYHIFGFGTILVSLLFVGLVLRFVGYMEKYVIEG